RFPDCSSGWNSGKGRLGEWAGRGSTSWGTSHLWWLASVIRILRRSFVSMLHKDQCTK
ncbi:hypothetical protein U1Q18_009434, partial [Sarracenia purpurea var. burkii]